MGFGDATRLDQQCRYKASVISFFGVLHVTLIAYKLDYWCHSCWCWGLIVEWRNLITGEKLHWSLVGLEPRSLQIAF